ncbi:hypothetical protein VTN96DRAFT_2786 [Rasamsonia emersonii]
MKGSNSLVSGRTSPISPGLPLDRDGNRLRFPHVIADDWTSGGVTVRERRMLSFINDITDKPGWEREVFDQAITAQWRAEACVWREDLNDVFLSSAMFDYCMQELRDKTVYYQKSGMVSVCCDTAVVKSDVLVPARLAESLQDAVRSLENVPE